MKNFVFTTKTYFQTLPQDLTALIFEFLTVPDFGNLSLVCKDFNSILRKNIDLWSKQLFQDFLLINPPDFHFTDEDLFPYVLPVKKAEIRYADMTHSKELLIEHYNIRKRWKSFFQLFLSPSDCSNFLYDVFAGIRKPSCPTPCLKKDIHFFPTNSIFQNFLTEVHFGIQGRSFFQEKKQTVIEKIVEQIETHYWARRIDKNELIRFRWYVFNNEESKREHDQCLRNLTVLSHRSRIIRKIEPRAPKLRLIKAFKSPSKDKIVVFITKMKNKTIQARRKFYLLKKSIKSKVQAKRKPRRKIREYSYHLENVRGSVEEFYQALQALIENYCKMVFMYLKLIQDPYQLLSEYVRLWNRFVFLIIDFNQTFARLATLFNKFYDKDFLDLPNFPEFSTWRFMARIWNDQIFSNMSYYLGECFRSVLLKLRFQEKSSSIKLIDEEKCAFCMNIYTSETEFEDLNTTFLYRFRKSATTNLTSDETIRLLKGFYHSVGDLSYSEYSIFYWDCTPTQKGTPKEILDTLIIQDTNSFYQYCKDCFLHDIDHVKDFMHLDGRLIESVLGKFFYHQIKKLQVTIIQGLLQQILIRVVEEVEHSMEAGCNGLLETFSNSSNSGENLNLSLREVFHTLQIGEEIQKKLIYNEEKRKKVVHKLGQDFKMFNIYIYYLKEEQEKIMLQNREFGEMKDHRQMRGFAIVEEKYVKLFDLGNHLTLEGIFKIGVEGRNLKEKLESLDDTIIFI